MSFYYDINVFGEMLITLNAAVESAKRKYPNFLETKLVDRYSSLLPRVGQIILGESQPDEAFDIEFKFVSRMICKFASRSCTLTWNEFEKENSLA